MGPTIYVRAEQLRRIYAEGHMLQPLLDQRMFWGATGLFKGLAKADLEALLRCTSHVSARGGKVIIRQGESGDQMYMILSGRVRVSVSPTSGENITVGELLQGDAFGEIALLDQQARTATVTTCEECEFSVLSRAAFHDYLMVNPQVAIELLAVMSRRLRATDAYIKDALHCNVASRLADTLRKLAHAYGKNTRDGLLLELDFSERELGEIAGVPVDVVAAHMRHWKNDGHITTHHGHLTLVRPDALDHTN